MHLFVFLLIPNAYFAAISYWLVPSDTRGVVNPVYLVIGILAIYWRPRICLPLLGAAFALDTLDTVSSGFGTTIPELVSLVSFAPMRHSLRLDLELLLFAIASAAACIGLMWRLRPQSDSMRHKHVIFASIAVVCCMGAVDFASGAASVDQHRRLVFASEDGPIVTPLLRSPETDLTRELVHPDERNAVLAVPSATGRITPALEAAWSKGIRPNVVLVVVESWGKAKEPQLESALSEPYRSAKIRSQYRVVMGDIAFHGLTIDGETRELCHSTLGLGAMRATAAGLFDCLPYYFRAAGYQTSAVHGNTGEMYHRRLWHRNAGFQSLWYKEELDQQGLRFCPNGMFPGICDYAIAPWIGDRLKQSSQPQFYHWVTLNSHLPTPDVLGPEYDFSCQRSELTRGSESACNWARIIRHTQESIADLASRPNIGETVFIVVGDHAPPFQSPSVHRQFSQTDVPYVMLIPKSL
jgi:hypothetical protein